MRLSAQFLIQNSKFLIRTAGAIRYLVFFLFFRFWARAMHK